MIRFMLVGVTSMALVACSAATADAPAEVQISQKREARFDIPGVSDEIALDTFSKNAHFHNCGGRYFKASAYSVDELKDPAFDLTQGELTQADSLNGISWHAAVSLRASATRSLTSGDRWGNWINNTQPLWLNEFVVRNERLEEKYDLSASTRQPFSCADVPPG